MLIVDDEPINLQVLKNILTLSGFSIAQAYDGPQCLRMLAEGEAPDIILLDVMMPGMTGFEVTDHIRRRFSPNDLPILLVTAKNQIKDLERGLASGANDYLTKPFSKAELLARMRTHLSLSRAHSAEAENRRKTEELEAGAADPAVAAAQVVAGDDLTSRSPPTCRPPPRSAATTTTSSPRTTARSTW